MKIIETKIPDVKLIEPKVFGDERGFFMETWNEKAFKEAGIDTHFVQDNQSRSVKHTLRGLHYQIKHPQGKLVRVTKGKVFDVAVDLRPESETFGKWIGEILSDENKRMLWVPPMFAHGFLVLSEVADFVYKCTNKYSPEHERAIVWDDPELDIRWPIQNSSSPIISNKDRDGYSFDSAKFEIINAEFE